MPIPYLIVVDPDGTPHFTMNNEARRQRCLRLNLCAICGQKLLRGKFYVGGPLSAFHEHGRYIDSPLHRECMTYALQVCPYLAAPKYTGRLDDSTFDHEKHPGTVILVDETMDPARPPIFVAVMAIGHRLSRNGIHGYLEPKKPYREIQYWRQGVRIPDAEGMMICSQALDQADAEIAANNGRWR